LHGMATIYFERSDLERALNLYHQALGITEKIGDLHGKAMTLGMMGQALWRFNRHFESLQALLDSMGILIDIGARPDVEMTVRIIREMRNDIGDEKFDTLWKEITGQKIPEWLYQSWKQDLDVTKQFIKVAIKAAREKDSEVKNFYEFTQKMATDSSSTTEMRELGRALSRILNGDTNVDLSRLPEELAELVREELRQ